MGRRCGGRINLYVFTARPAGFVLDVHSMDASMRDHMKRFIRGFLFVLPVLFPGFAWGWGCTGHEVIALVALKRLDPGTRGKLDRALAKVERHYPDRYCSDIQLPAVAYFATWADDYRSEHKETGPWHYWDIPLERTTATASEFCDEGCVVRALAEQLAIMQDRLRPKEERLHALLFVIHFVGDVHQPLHAEDNEDRGGNCVPVDFLDKRTEPHIHERQPTANYSPNLHGIWDTDLVEYIGGVRTRDRQSLESFADRLEHVYASQMDGWAKQKDPVHWALESHAAARDVAYRQLPEPIVAVPYHHAIQECSDDGTSARYATKHEAANAAYIAAVRTTVESRLAAAGARLAAVLESHWPADWN